jgi:hypothetical protein
MRPRPPVLQASICCKIYIMCHLLRLFKAVCTVMAPNWMPSSPLTRELHRYLPLEGDSEKSYPVSSLSLGSDSGDSGSYPPIRFGDDSEKPGSVSSLSLSNDSDASGPRFPLLLGDESGEIEGSGSELEAKSLCDLEAKTLDKGHVQRNIRIGYH